MFKVCGRLVVRLGRFAIFTNCQGHLLSREGAPVAMHEDLKCRVIALLIWVTVPVQVGYYSIMCTLHTYIVYG
jgi:hypothetical protein